MSAADSPNANVTIVTDTFDPETLVGRHFEVPKCYVDETGEYLAMVYYFDHQDMDEVVVDILARQGNLFQVRWTGVTDDVDSYDGSEPRNHVVIEAWFEMVATVEDTVPKIKVNPTIPKPVVEAEAAEDKDQLQLW